MPRRKVLFFVEGFTDIRFVTGLAGIADLTLCVPRSHYESSGLKQRVHDSGATLDVVEIEGGRLAFQSRSFAWLWQHARNFDVILSQELLRGSLNATLIGALRGTPVVTTIALPPVEYFRCRRTRGQLSAPAALAGELVIRSLMTVNGALSTRCLALGTYLEGIASRYCRHVEWGGYYGVDTTVFTPAGDAERRQLREKRDLPRDAFIVFLSSRISHEKDPETVLRATAKARAQGLNAVLLNLSGGYQEFLALGRSLGLADAESWVLGRPAAHPMTDVADYFKAADVIAQGSLEEGLGLSPLEGLACGTPVVATSIGGMAVTLPGYARLVPLRDPDAMAEQFLWIAAHRDEARAQALRGREMVVRDWSRTHVFADLARVFDDVAREREGGAGATRQAAGTAGA